MSADQGSFGNPARRGARFRPIAEIDGVTSAIPMTFPAEVMPRQRRLLISIGVAIAACEWAAAVGARYARGATQSLLGALALFLALSLFVGGFLRPGGSGRSAFLANFLADTIIYGSVFLGFFLFSLGPLVGTILGIVLAPAIGLVFAIR